ncbi:MAG: TRAP transporter fused permease subunit, partial [Desulfobacterales bacterium]|nr:TRAP transporter fused permease subunit [Desulfobacterales bacterium]
MQNAKTQKGLPVDGVTIAITIVALAMVIYHMTSAQYIIQSAELFLNTHIGMALILVFLGKAQYARGIKRHLTLLAVLLSVAATGYVQIFYTELTDRVWFNTPLDLFVGVILILLVLEATRESFGLVLPVMILIIVIFPFFGQYFPEPFNCTALSISKTISNLSIGLSGIYGTVLSVSANYIFLFILFGSVLQGAGATRLFTQIGGLVGGKLRGGAGLTAVVSSALLGSVTGSVAANIAITGSFTIPLMKKMGYSPEEAGAIEAAASNGGQIMPPIMGISAFAMAAITGIPYINIVVMAIIPALLYFISVGAYVQLRAMKRQLTPTREEVDVRELLLSLPVFLFPFGVIIGLLVMDFSVAYVAFWSIISTLAVSLARKKGRSSLREIMEGFIQGAKEGAKIAVMCGAIGLFLETFITSGLGIKLAAGIETWSGGHLFPALVIIGMICVLMGMGGPAMTA